MGFLDKVLSASITVIIGLVVLSGYLVYEERNRKPNEYVKDITVSSSNLSIDSQKVYVVKLEGCLYYATRVCGGFTLTHVGNCPNHGFTGIAPKSLEKQP